LTRLVSEGLLTVRARRGYFVTSVTANALAVGYDVRLALELHAAERAIDGRATPELVVFRSLLDSTATTISHEEWDAANAAFLEYQIDLAGNTLLSRFYRELSVNLLMQVIRGGSRRRPCEHRHGARPYRRGLRSEGPRTSPQRDPGAHRDGTPDRARGDRARRRRPLDVLTTDV
jgi:DNA-binding GntR family transcriptional regulator